MNLATSLALRTITAGGPGSGCHGDNCGRPAGTGLTLGAQVPPKDKPVTVVLGGSFNPPHQGHVGAAQHAADLLTQAGYKVQKIVIAPTADRLLQKKLGDRMYPLADRTEMARRTFPSTMDVTSGPAEDAEKTEGKLRRTQLADWVGKKYPGTTVVNVTGQDSSPGSPPAAVSLYSGDKGTAHEGYYYLQVAREEGGLSSTKIRQEVANGQKPEGMTDSAHAYLKNLLTRRPDIKLVASRVWPMDVRAHHRRSAAA